MGLSGLIILPNHDTESAFQNT